MKTALLKDGIKEIKNSYKRFISLLLIVLLGVGFFAGIKATSPDMRKTLDTYFDSLNVMDIQVISTLGLTEDDVQAIKEVENVENAEATYQTDAIVTIGDEEVVVKVETLTNDINNLNLIEGRIPENAQECVVEPRFLSGTGHTIGDTITIDIPEITNDEGEKEEVLKNNQVTIVGTVESPLYISTDRGNTTLGSGVIDYYLYVSKDNLNASIFTNIYVTVDGSKELETDSNKYNEKIEQVKDNLDAISEERREARYNELYNTANSKIEDAQKELDEEKAKAEKELEDAQKEIDDGKEKIEEGKAEIQANRSKANSEFAKAEQELEDAKKELEQGKNEFEAQQQKAQEQIKNYEEQLSMLEQTQKQLQQTQENLSKAKTELDTLQEKLNNAETEEEKEELQKQIATATVKVQTLQGTIDIINSELEKQGITDLANTITQLRNGINAANEELENAETQLENAQKQIEEGTKELQNQKSSTYYQLNQAEAEIEKSEQEIADGEKELEEARKEFDEQIKEAEDKLYEAKEDLREIKRPEWYVLDREQNTGYVNYIQDTERVANLAEVFPVVFFLVAALMSLNSMSRMVEEERVQIGTLKALGYSKRQIIRKYIIYAVLATLIGGSLGLSVGFSYLPKVIADIYAMVYDVPDVILEFNTGYAFAGIAAALLCTVGATLYTALKQLRQNPATLMRPKAPKPGKRVLLEKIPFIWKHLNFTAKVTARNIFRYKQRFLMTIIGVCGCTSLIIAGFGLRDAISNMIPLQYGEIYKYDINVTLKEEKEGEELSKVEDEILQKEKILEVQGANIQSVKIIKNDNNQSIQLVVPEDINSIGNFISLRSRTNKKDSYTLDSSGAIITEKLARLLDIKEGDTITIENADGDRADVKVAHISENYILHYLYMSPDLYNTIYDTKIKYNTVLAKTEELTEEDEEQIGKVLLQDEDNLSGVSFTSAASGMLETVMNNMDMVVWILIIAAGMLALVVLYNLLNANISERIRELATIKVLGFYDREVYEYIGRETIILTILGMLTGLIGGYYLTMYILKTCEIDMLMFDPEIRIMSYILGIIITTVFAIIVNVITYFSLKKIDMIESLKSVE